MTNQASLMRLSTNQSMQMALQLDRPLRVLDLATTLLLPKSLNIAIRLAERSRQPKLAEKIALVLEVRSQWRECNAAHVNNAANVPVDDSQAKEQALLALEEERAAKRAPQYYYEPRAANLGPQRMDMDTDRDAQEAARDPSPPRKQVRRSLQIQPTGRALFIARRSPLLMRTWPGRAAGGATGRGRRKRTLTWMTTTARTEASLPSRRRPNPSSQVR
jgi:hypothetical protein